MANPNDLGRVGPNADLRGADLSWANLFRVDLRGADLSQADLRNTRLLEADLGNADLSGAILIGTDLREANLQGAKLVDVKHSKRTRWPAGIAPDLSTRNIDPAQAKRRDGIKPAEEITLPNMLAQVRSWAKWMIGWGLVNLLFSGLSNPFGAILLITGVGTYYFGAASAFIIIAVVYAWAAVSNLFVGGALAYFFAVVIALSAWSAVRQFKRFRQLEADARANAAAEKFDVALVRLLRSERLLPWSAVSLAGIASIGAILSFGKILVDLSMGEPVANLSLLAYGFAVQLGALALACGLAALLSNYRLKLLSLIGAGGGALIVVIQVALMALAR